MNLEGTNLFELASQRLKWLSDRQKVVSENIANADTAGYRAREVQGFEDYLQMSEGMSVAPDATVLDTESTWGQDLSGNNVVLEEQIMVASDTRSQHQIASKLYSKAHAMLRMTAGG